MMVYRVARDVEGTWGILSPDGRLFAAFGPDEFDHEAVTSETYSLNYQGLHPDVWAWDDASDFTFSSDDFEPDPETALREKIATEIEAKMTDPDRLRPRVNNATSGANFVNDWEWAVMIVRGQA